MTLPDLTAYIVICAAYFAAIGAVLRWALSAPPTRTADTPQPGALARHSGRAGGWRLTDAASSRTGRARSQPAGAGRAEIARRFRAAFTDDDWAQLSASFAQICAEAATSRDAACLRQVEALSAARMRLVAVTPTEVGQAHGEAVALAFANGVILRARARRDAARLLAAQLWRGPVTLAAAEPAPPGLRLVFAGTDGRQPLTLHDLQVR